MPISFPYTLTDGTTASAAHVQANLDEIKNAMEVDKYASSEILTTPYADVVFGPFTIGSLGTSVTKQIRWKLKSTTIFLSAQICIDGTSGGGVARLDLKRNDTAASILSATVSASAADTLGERTISSTSVPADTEMMAEIVETSGAGSCTDVSVTVWAKVAHRS